MSRPSVIAVTSHWLVWPVPVMGLVTVSELFSIQSVNAESERAHGLCPPGLVFFAQAGTMILVTRSGSGGE